MDFFDPKEDVLEVKLTPWGRHKLSKGGFRPTWYAFFDEGILYNSNFARTASAPGGESQNNIQDRILNNTPSLKPLNVTEGIQTAITRRNEAIQKIFGTEIAFTGPGQLDSGAGMDQAALQSREVNIAGALGQVNIAGGEMVELSSDPLFMDPSVVYDREELEYATSRMANLQEPLGTSKISSDKNPAFHVAMRLGEIVDSSQGFTGSLDAIRGTASIPQVNIKVRYTTYVNQIPDYSVDMGTNADFFTTEPENNNNLESVTTDILSNGMYLIVEKGELVLGIEEKNTDFHKENFDIEVFLSSSVADIETEQLKFDTPGIAPYTSENVQYYLNIDSDNEISSDILQKANIQDFTALGPDPGSGIVSTRQYFIKDLYSPEEDICD